jgi:hypothetical protein
MYRALDSLRSVVPLRPLRTFWTIAPLHPLGAFRTIRSIASLGAFGPLGSHAMIRSVLAAIAPVVPSIASIVAPLDAGCEVGLSRLRERDADICHGDEPGRQQRRDDSSLHDSLLVYR